MASMHEAKMNIGYQLLGVSDSDPGEVDKIANKRVWSNCFAAEEH